MDISLSKFINFNLVLFVSAVVIIISTIIYSVMLLVLNY